MGLAFPHWRPMADESIHVLLEQLRQLKDQADKLAELQVEMLKQLEQATGKADDLLDKVDRKTAPPL